MDSSSPGSEKQCFTLHDIARYIQGAAQALAWLNRIEEQRLPLLEAASLQLHAYAESARQAAESGDTSIFDEFVSLRIGTLAALLSVAQDRWEAEESPITTWSFDALAEIAYWLEWVRDSICEVLSAVQRAA